MQIERGFPQCNSADLIVMAAEVKLVVQMELFEPVFVEYFKTNFIF